MSTGNGNNDCDNDWKLPPIYLAMFVLPILSWPGRLSLDRAIRERLVGR